MLRLRLDVFCAFISYELCIPTSFFLFVPFYFHIDPLPPVVDAPPAVWSLRCRHGSCGGLRLERAPDGQSYDPPEYRQAQRQAGPARRRCHSFAPDRHPETSVYRCFELLVDGEHGATAENVGERDEEHACGSRRAARARDCG